MSTDRDRTRDVLVCEPPTRVLSARELREQLGASSDAGHAEREPPTRPLSRAELEREIARAEANASDDTDEAETRWLPRSLAARRSDVTRPAYVVPALPLSAVRHEATATSLESGVLRAEVPRLGRGHAPPPVDIPALPTAGSEPALELPPPPERARSWTRWAALVASLMLLLLAVRLGATRGASHVAERPSRAVSPATPVAVPPAPVAVPTPLEAALPPGSRRRALDLLLGGQRAEALDAYRALAHERPGQPVYAQLVELLEREARSCAEPGTCP